MNLFVCYPKCSTCKKAENWLKEREVPYTFRDIKLDHPSRDELQEWYKKSGLDIKRFFNTSGNLYKELKLIIKSKTINLYICLSRYSDPYLR